jgi:hypothetical protein
VITRNLKGLALAELLNAANKHYGDGHLSRYFDGATGRFKRGSGDSLAQFIVRELGECFDSAYQWGHQVAAAVEALELAKMDLQRAIDGLREL